MLCVCGGVDRGMYEGSGEWDVGVTKGTELGHEGHDINRSTRSLLSAKT